MAPSDSVLSSIINSDSNLNASLISLYESVYAAIQDNANYSDAEALISYNFGGKDAMKIAIANYENILGDTSTNLSDYSTLHLKEVYSSGQVNTVITSPRKLVEITLVGIEKATVQAAFDAHPNDFLSAMGKVMDNAEMAPTLSGTQNDDTFSPINAFEIIDGGSGVDTVDYSSSDVTNLRVNLGAEIATELLLSPAIPSVSATGEKSGVAFTHSFRNIETIIGTSNPDVFVGGSGDDIFIGVSGGDAFYASGGNDTIVGGSGSNDLDTLVYYDDGISDLVVNLETNTVTGKLDNVAFTQSVTNIDHVQGSSSADQVIGSVDNDILYTLDGNDIIHGGDGNDDIHSGNGDDTIVGGKGHDNITTGSGEDIIVLRTGDGGSRLVDADYVDFEDVHPTTYRQNLVARLNHHLNELNLNLNN